jgi:hypothetical protein
MVGKMIKMFEQFMEGEPVINLKEFNPYNDVYLYYKDKEPLSGFNSQKYIDFMLKILKPGKYVIFQGNNDKKEELQARGYIKKSIQPKPGVASIHIILDNDKEYGLYPSEVVKIFDEEPEKVYKEDDPYGEEDWFE